jgi:hypothetical protein
MELERKYRQRLHRLHLPLYCIWLVAIIMAIYTSVVSRLAANDLGSPIPIQYALVMWGVTLGWVIPDACYAWQQHVTRTLYCEDIADGTCPDRGAAITPENGWNWYRQQGSPWRISAQRKRPWTHPADALARLEGRDPPPRQRPKW